MRIFKEPNTSLTHNYTHVITTKKTKSISCGRREYDTIAASKKPRNLVLVGDAGIEPATFSV